METMNINIKEKVEDTKVKDTKVKDETENQCAVCYDELTIENAVVTPCKHKFCSDCFFKWLKESNTCPLCRKNYTRYTAWEYTNIDIEKTTHEFNLFRDIIGRTKDALSGHYKKKRKLERKIEKMNKAVDVNDIYIKQKQQSCIRMNKDLEYKKGYYKSKHFPISEMDLYNLLHDDEETKEWKNGFICGFERKYNCDIINNYNYIVDPFITRSRNALTQLSKHGEISLNKYDTIKNDIHKLISCLAKHLSKEEFIDLFNGGVLNKNGSDITIGMPLELFNKVNTKMLEFTIPSKIYVDFIYDNTEKTWFKTPYHMNENNQMCYFNYEVKIDSKTYAKGYTIKRKSKHSDILNNLHNVVDNLVNIVEKSVSI